MINSNSIQKLRNFNIKKQKQLHFNLSFLCNIYISLVQGFGSNDMQNSSLEDTKKPPHAKHFHVMCQKSLNAFDATHGDPYRIKICFLMLKLS